MTDSMALVPKPRNGARRHACVLPLLILAVTLAQADAGTFDAALPEMEWQIGQGIPAPWRPTAQGMAESGVRPGQHIRFSMTGVSAPKPLACSKPQHEYVRSPAEGLFQGMLPPPAASGAAALGIARLPVLTLRISCDGGVFDYHLISSDRVLIGIDNIIWPLIRDGGEMTPEHVVLALLQSHLTDDMGFTPKGVARKRVWLSDALDAAITAYFRRPLPAGEVPPINGDPFTNAQEYPDGFVQGQTAINSRHATVPIRFDGGAHAQVVELLLYQSDGKWQVDDLRYEDGTTLRDRLNAASP